MSVLTLNSLERGLALRITLEEKSATRERIVEVALGLFRTRGFDATTTRDIADGAKIAAGTLFNYFPAKEAIVVSVAGGQLAKAHAEFAKHEVPADLGEALFALVALELRHLKNLRKFLTPIVELTLSPLAANNVSAESQSAWRAHLDLVHQQIFAKTGVEPASVTLQMYAALYAGLLAFWIKDHSPKQEDTLALLDQSIAMFVNWLSANSNQGERT